MRFMKALLVSAFLALGAVACGPDAGDLPEYAGPAPQEGERNDTKITVDQTNFSHSVGKTSCPQKIGTVTIKNNRSEPIKWSASRTDSLGKSATSLSKTSGNLAAGESVVVDVMFTCSQTTDVAEQWTVVVDSAVDGSRLNDTAVNLTGTVK